MKVEELCPAKVSGRAIADEIRPELEPEVELLMDLNEVMQSELIDVVVVWLVHGEACLYTRDPALELFLLRKPVKTISKEAD